MVLTGIHSNAAGSLHNALGTFCLHDVVLVAPRRGVSKQFCVGGSTECEITVSGKDLRGGFNEVGPLDVEDCVDAADDWLSRWNEEGQNEEEIKGQGSCEHF